MPLKSALSRAAARCLTSWEHCCRCSKARPPRPDISTPDKFKAALMAAKTVGYSQGASGSHVQTVIEKLGIADAVKAKAVIAQGRPVGAAVASGEAEIGMQQVAELRP